MERFAKIIETPTTQVLFFLEFDDDDQTILHAIGRAHGTSFDVKGFYLEEEKAKAALDRLDEAYALNLVEKMNALVQS